MGKIIKALLINLLKIYQFLISPLLSNTCRFYPSCSHYTIHALQIRGIRMGLYLSFKRVLRCHPWCQGGIDTIPEK